LVTPRARKNRCLPALAVSPLLHRAPRSGRYAGFASFGILRDLLDFLPVLSPSCSLIRIPVLPIPRSSRPHSNHMDMPHDQGLSWLARKRNIRPQSVYRS
jgi:hypothetical protein